MDASDVTTTFFVVYLYHHTEKPDGVAQKICTALSHWFASNHIPWRRPPNFRKLFTGYKDLKPSRKFVRSPFCREHLLAAATTEFCSINEYTGCRNLASLATHYYFGLRGGEGCPYKLCDGHTVLQREHLVFTPEIGENCVQVAIDLSGHKGDRFSKWDALVPISCECTGKPEDDRICGVHLLSRFCQIRDALLPKRGQLFCNADGSVFTHSKLNKLIKRVATSQGLNADRYTPHSCRSGRATDLVRAGKDSRAIKKWGRWHSRCWEDFYLKLHLLDLSILTRLSLNELGVADTALYDRVKGKSTSSLTSIVAQRGRRSKNRSLSSSPAVNRNVKTARAPNPRRTLVDKRWNPRTLRMEPRLTPQQAFEASLPSLNDGVIPRTLTTDSDRLTMPLREFADSTNHNRNPTQRVTQRTEQQAVLMNDGSWFLRNSTTLDALSSVDSDRRVTRRRLKNILNEQ